jgi:hypothetical protein
VEGNGTRLEQIADSLWENSANTTERLYNRELKLAALYNSNDWDSFLAMAPTSEAMNGGDTLGIADPAIRFLISAYRVCEGAAVGSVISGTVRSQQEWLYASNGQQDVNLRERFVMLTRRRVRPQVSIALCARVNLSMRTHCANPTPDRYPLPTIGEARRLILFSFLLVWLSR